MIQNCENCYKSFIKKADEFGGIVSCFSCDEDSCEEKIVISSFKENKNCKNHFFYNDLLFFSKDEKFNKVYKKIFQPNFIEDEQLLKIVKPETGETIAHIQAKYGWMTDILGILKLKDNNDWTVAHEQAKRGWLTSNEEILMLKDKDNLLVAELEIIMNDYFTENIDILKMPNCQNNKTLAHIQASKGWKTENKELLKLKDEDGINVEEYIVRADRIISAYGFYL